VAPCRQDGGAPELLRAGERDRSTARIQNVRKKPSKTNPEPRAVLMQNKNESLPVIDLLRGVSALGVVLHHSRVDLWVGFREIRANPDAYSGLDRALSWLSLPASQFGYLVMLFFVISGFCIHLPQAARDTPVQLRSYCLRRFFRIFPPYVAALVFCLLVEMAFRLSDQPRGSSAGIFVASFTMVQNYVFQGGQVPSNPSLWSIPVEVELYIVYPLLLAFLRARGWSMGAGLILTAMFSAVAMAFYAAGWSWPDTNFLKFWVLWWSGAWLAERWRKGELPAWGRFAWLCTGVVTASLLAGMHWNLDHAYMHFVWGAASFLLVWRCLYSPIKTLQHGSVRGSLMGFIVRIGVISYSLYLIHFPLLQLFGLLWRQCLGSKPSSFLIPLLGSILCIPIAWIFYRFIEKPSHLLGKQLARSN